MNTFLNAQISVHVIEVLSPSFVYFFSLFFFGQTDLKHKQRYYTRKYFTLIKSEEHSIKKSQFSKIRILFCTYSIVVSPKKLHKFSTKHEVNNNVS